jgi:hypothetical protein
MNKISLEKIDSSSSNCLHVKMLINDNDVGVLYLKEEEVDILIKTLKRGIYSSEVKLESNIFDDEDDFDDSNDHEIE